MIFQAYQGKPLLANDMLHFSGASLSFLALRI